MKMLPTMTMNFVLDADDATTYQPIIRARESINPIREVRVGEADK